MLKSFSIRINNKRVSFTLASNEYGEMDEAYFNEYTKINNNLNEGLINKNTKSYYHSTLIDKWSGIIQARSALLGNIEHKEYKSPIDYMIGDDPSLFEEEYTGPMTENDHIFFYASKVNDLKELPVLNSCDEFLEYDNHEIEFYTFYLVNRIVEFEMLPKHIQILINCNDTVVTGKALIEVPEVLKYIKIVA